MEEWEQKANKARDEYLKLDRREERIGFLKKWGKDIPGSLFKPGMGMAAQPVDPLAPPVPPEFVAIEGRRFLVLRGFSGVNVIVVDAHGTCDAQANHGGPYHLYRRKSPYADTAWGRVSLRCPNSLSQEEWKRVFMDRPTAVEWAKNNPLGKKATKAEDWLEE